MYFAKDEIIELSGGKKHIILETTKYNDNYYYYVCEINKDESDLIENYNIITTVTENGNLFVKTIKDELALELEKIFKEKLGI